MTEATALKLALELDRDSEAIAGRLCHAEKEAPSIREGEEVWHFTGWVELTRALEEARTEAASEDATT